MEEKEIIIGSRGSDLALWQAHYLQDRLKEIGYNSVIKIIKTQGDKIQHLTFDKLEGKGFFTKEIEDQLLAKEIDVAVHSMKDLPTTNPPGLQISGTSYREDPTDTLLLLKETVDPNEVLKLKKGTIVGTSSARRKVQIKALNPNIEIKDIRGNVPTRINKLREGQFGAILLATAGIKRLKLDLSDLEVIQLHPREFVPAPAQGVLAYQTRNDDDRMKKIISKISDMDVARITNVERKVLNLFDGGCQLPLGVYCEKDQLGNYHTWAAMAKDVNSPLIKTRISHSTAAELAQAVFEDLTNKLT